MRRQRIDLALVGLCAMANLGLLLVPGLQGPVRILLGAPMVLIVPGYAVHAALEPSRRSGWPERLAFALGVSLSLAALLGLVLNLGEAGLRRETWTGGLAVITLAGCGTAAVRQRKAPDLFVLPTSAPRRRDAFSFAGVLAVGAIAFGVATASAQQPRQGFSELWLVPADTGFAPSVGLRSQELSPTVFRVQVASGASILLDSSFTLEPGQSWQTNLEPPDPTLPLDATAYRDGSDVPYRHTHVAPQSPGTTP